MSETWTALHGRFLVVREIQVLFVMTKTDRYYMQNQNDLQNSSTNRNAFIWRRKLQGYASARALMLDAETDFKLGENF